ncbi:MAG TPA: hypothetical protein VIA06_21785 [Candidatus Dormibacteraeota bacterium]|jgi:hypothetical protein|nr:hypothetical protein [Candidatus Dormibacteraeota bacterium]
MSGTAATNAAWLLVDRGRPGRSAAGQAAEIWARRRGPALEGVFDVTHRSERVVEGGVTEVELRAGDTDLRLRVSSRPLAARRLNCAGTVGQPTEHGVEPIRAGGEIER